MSRVVWSIDPIQRLVLIDTIDYSINIDAIYVNGLNNINLVQRLKHGLFKVVIAYVYS